MAAHPETLTDVNHDQFSEDAFQAAKMRQASWLVLRTVPYPEVPKNYKNDPAVPLTFRFHSYPLVKDRHA